jgi:hypothetical protein
MHTSDDDAPDPAEDQEICATANGGVDCVVTLAVRRRRAHADTPQHRFAVLTIVPRRVPRAYVVFDRLLSRIVDGVYASRQRALACATWYEQHGCPGDRAPNATALGLIFPPPERTRKASHEA